jgi:hypothetical protein
MQSGALGLRFTFNMAIQGLHAVRNTFAQFINADHIPVQAPTGKDKHPPHEVEHTNKKESDEGKPNVFLGDSESSAEPEITHAL